MAGLADVRSGLKTRLETISGLRVYGNPPDSKNEMPCAVIDFTAIPDYEAVLGANDFEGAGSIYLYVSRPGSNTEGADDLDGYMSPTGANSIKAAVAGDATLGGAVDWCKVKSAKATRARTDEGWYFEADFGFEFWKTVA